MKYMLLFFVLIGCTTLLYSVDLIINEVCSSNTTVIADHLGNYEDWIELRNTSAVTINLNQYYLSDSVTNKTKFRFPVGSYIEPGQIIFVWAVNNVTPIINPNGDYWGTNFAISANGEPVALSYLDPIDATVTIVDQMPSIAIPANVSYGRVGASLDWFYFIEPTPKTENTTQGYTALLSDPVAAVSSGWYPENTEVNFTTSMSGVEIRYTTDGSDPTEISPIWTGAITLQNRSSEPNQHSMISTVLPNLPEPVNELDLWSPPNSLVPKIHTIKTRCFGTGALPSKIVTCVYLVGINLYEFPIVTVTMDPDDLWDADTGIYVPGNGYDGSNFLTANFMQNWERKAVSDWFDAQGNHFWQKQSDIEIHGNYTARAGQKSLRFKAADLSGANSLNYPFFGTDYLDHFKHLILRNSGNDVHMTMFRDNFVHTIIKEQGLDTANYRPFIVFLNGEFWGIHNLQEHMQEHYVSNHYDIPLTQLDVIERNLDVLSGDSADYSSILSYLELNDESDPSVWQYLETKIDMQNFKEYMSAEIIAGNTDWPGNNIRYWRKKVPYTPGAPYGHDGRWRWLVYDMDFSYGLYQSPAWIHDTLGRAIDPTLEWRTFLLRSLLNNQGFKNDFINTFADRLNYNWEPNKVINLVNQFQTRNYNTMPAHIERWNFPQSFALWLGEVQFLRDFANNRPDYLRSLIVSHFSLSGVANVTLSITPPGAAIVRINDRIDLVSGNYKYFQGVPISLEATFDPRWEIADFGGQQTSTLNLTPGANQTINLVLKPKTPQNFTIQKDGTNLLLSWDAVYGATYYQVEYTDNPYNQIWSALPLTSQTSLTILQTETEARKFYRVKSIY